MNAQLLTNGIATELQVRLSSRLSPVHAAQRLVAAYLLASRPSPAQG